MSLESTQPSEMLITTLVICINKRFRIDQRSCAMGGSPELVKMIESGVKARRINIKIETTVCFGHCSKGPVMRMIPGGKFYHEVCKDDIAGIVDELEELCGTKPDQDEMQFAPGS